MEQLTAVRLRPYAPDRGHRMRTYTSSSLQLYRAGDATVPSSWRVVADAREVAELREIPQFEVLPFASLEALAAHVQVEMEQRARQGLPPIRAYIEGLPDEQRANLERALGGAQAPAPPARDLSVLAVPPAAPEPPPPPAVHPRSAEAVDVDDLSIDYDAEIAALEAKIAAGGVSARTLRKYQADLRRLQLDKQDAAAERAAAAGPP